MAQKITSLNWAQASPNAMIRASNAIIYYLVFCIVVLDIGFKMKPCIWSMLLLSSAKLMHIHPIPQE